MSQSLILQPGMSLASGRYQLDRLLHQGRSSLTLQGIHVSSGKGLIFKFPIQDQGLLPAHRQRFQYIWQRAGHFQSPYLQQTVDYLEEQGVPCLVLEYIEGTPLLQRVTAQAPLSETTALRIIFQVAQAVEQLHDRGLIHGDLSPQNLIQNRQGSGVVLVDWGLFWQGWNSNPLSPYRPPEPFLPSEFRVSVDVYGLAACLYALVTGHPPIAAAQQSTTPLVLPQTLNPQLTELTQTAIVQGMDLNPDRRPNSVQAWLTLLPRPYSSAQLPNMQPQPMQPQPMVTAATVVVPGAVSPSVAQPDPTQTQAAVSPQSPNLPPSNFPKNGVAKIKSTGTPSTMGDRPLRKILLTMGIAAGVGLAFGGLLRWQKAQARLGHAFFQQAQSFPTRDWPGTVNLNLPSDAPVPDRQGTGGYVPEPSVEWAPTPTPQFVEPTVPDRAIETPPQSTPEATIAPSAAPVDSGSQRPTDTPTSQPATPEPAPPATPVPEGNSSGTPSNNNGGTPSGSTGGGATTSGGGDTTTNNTSNSVAPPSGADQGTSSGTKPLPASTP